MADLRVDTNKMTDYADRIDVANQRIATLDRQLNSLYFSFGLLDVFRIIQADMLLSYSSTLQQCSSYLRETATTFETIERTLAAQDPLNFDPSVLLNTVSFNPVVPDWMHIGLTPQELFGNPLIMLGCATLSPLTTMIIRNFVTDNFEHDGHFNFNILDENGHLTLEGIDIWGMFSNKDSLWSIEGEGDFWDDFLHLHGGIGAMTGGVWGEGRYQFYNSETGEFQPGAAVNLEAEAAVLHIFGDGSLGDDQFGEGASIDLNGAYAYAGGDFRGGYIGEDAYGTDIYGVTARGGALASVFHGGATYTLTIGGVDITFGAGYDYLGAGGDFDYGITNRGVNGTGEIAWGGGISVSLGIDWTDNRDICNFIDEGVDWALDQGETFYNNVTDGWNTVVDFGHSAVETGVDMWNTGVDSAHDWFNDRVDDLQDAGDAFFDFLGI